MTDQEFLRALESCTLPESQFGHAAHVRAAYLYLQQSDFAGSLDRIRRAIRNYAAHLGKPQRYHETITVAYVALIQEQVFERPMHLDPFPKLGEGPVREHPAVVDDPDRVGQLLGD